MSHAHILHHPRRLASGMLFVWLFALLVAWTNACVSQPLSPFTHAWGHHDPAGFEANVAADADGTHGSELIQHVCAVFCDTDQRLASKAVASDDDGNADFAIVGAAAFDGWWSLVTEPAEPHHWQPSAALLPPGPSVAIAFLRLTL